MDRSDQRRPSKARVFSDSGPGGSIETAPLKQFTKLKHGRLIPSKSKWYSRLYAYNWLLNARGTGIPSKIKHRPCGVVEADLTFAASPMGSESKNRPLRVEIAGKCGHNRAS